MPKYNIINGIKFIEDLNNKLSTLRTNRVNASTLDHISVFVPAWDGNFKIQELGTINNPLPNVLLITPFDNKATLNLIEKAVRDSNLGVNPVNDGAGLKINFPSLTTEDKEKRAKLAKEYSEEEKIKIRNKRKDLITEQKALIESKEITKDQLETFEKDLQKEIDILNSEIDSLIKVKQEELMKV
jgi:ribosome recycling factor